MPRASLVAARRRAQALASLSSVRCPSTIWARMPIVDDAAGRGPPIRAGRSPTSVVVPSSSRCAPWKTTSRSGTLQNLVLSVGLDAPGERGLPEEERLAAAQPLHAAHVTGLDAGGEGHGDPPGAVRPAGEAARPDADRLIAARGERRRADDRRADGRRLQGPGPRRRARAADVGVRGHPLGAALRTARAHPPAGRRGYVGPSLRGRRRRAALPRRRGDRRGDADGGVGHGRVAARLSAEHPRAELGPTLPSTATRRTGSSSAQKSVTDSWRSPGSGRVARAISASSFSTRSPRAWSSGARAA